MKAHINLSIEESVIKEAKEKDLNLSDIAERAIKAELEPQKDKLLIRKKEARKDYLTKLREINLELEKIPKKKTSKILPEFIKLEHAGINGVCWVCDRCETVNPNENIACAACHKKLSIEKLRELKKYLNQKHI